MHVQTLTYILLKPFLSGFPSLFQWYDIDLAVYFSGMTQGLHCGIPDFSFSLTFFLPGHFYLTLCCHHTGQFATCQFFLTFTLFQ